VDNGLVLQEGGGGVQTKVLDSFCLRRRLRRILIYIKLHVLWEFDFLSAQGARVVLGLHHSREAFIVEDVAVVALELEVLAIFLEVGPAATAALLKAALFDEFEIDGLHGLEKVLGQLFVLHLRFDEHSATLPIVNTLRDGGL